MIKINNTNFKTNIVSLAAVFFILLALGVFGYYYYYKEDNDVYDKNNFTISAAMANANKAGVIICAIIEFILVFYLHSLRNNYLITILGGILVAIIIGIIISILYVTPENNPSGHIALAGVGFAAILIYNFLILSILYVNYKQLWLLILLLIPNFIIAISLIVAICIPHLIIENVNDDLDTITTLDTLFAVGELVMVFLLLVTLILLGFYKKDKKDNINIEKKDKKDNNKIKNVKRKTSKSKQLK